MYINAPRGGLIKYFKDCPLWAHKFNSGDSVVVASLSVKQEE